MYIATQCVIGIQYGACMSHTHRLFSLKMTVNCNSVKKQFETMTLRYTNDSRVDPKHGMFEVIGSFPNPAQFLTLAKSITNRDNGLKELFGENMIEEFKERLEYSALNCEPVDDEFFKKSYCNVGHFLCDFLKMGTFPRQHYDKLAVFVKQLCPDFVSLKSVNHKDYLQKFSIVIANTGSDVDAVIDVLFGDQTLKVSTILIQESLEQQLKMKLSVKCANLLENGYSTGYGPQTMLVANQAKKLGAKVGEFKSAENIIAFVYDLLPLKTYEHGNVFFIVPFRSASEAAKLAANVTYVAASVWGDTSAALSIARRLNCINVWINCHGLGHPSVPMYPQLAAKLPPLPFYPKICMMQMLSSQQLKPYHEIIRHWAIVPNRSPSTGRDVLSRNLGPAGLVTIPWHENTVNWMIPAIATGNRVVITYMGTNQVAVQAFIALFSPFLPPGLILNLENNTDETEFVYINERKIVKSGVPSDDTILRNMVRTQYIWLAEAQPL